MLARLSKILSWAACGLFVAILLIVVAANILRQGGEFRLTRLLARISA
jgi:TRAP-type C4-dicarboxylate transport system permease small subunit